MAQYYLCMYRWLLQMSPFHTIDDQNYCHAVVGDNPPELCGKKAHGSFGNIHHCDEHHPSFGGVIRTNKVTFYDPEEDIFITKD